MIIFQIKNLVTASFSSLGLSLITPTTINVDALPYILYLNNFIESGNVIPIGRNSQSEMTFDVIIASKDQVLNQTNAQTCYDYLTSEQFQLDAAAQGINLSSISNSQNQDEFDPTSGINTIVLSMRLNYITHVR